MGWVPQPLHLVIAGDFFLRQYQVRHGDAPRRLADTEHLHQHFPRMQEMMEAIARQDNVELVGRKRKTADVTDLPAHVRQSLFGLEDYRTFDHCRSQIDSRNLPGDPRRGTGNGTSPASNIEDLMNGSDVGHPEEQLRRFLVAREPGEVDGLPAELIDDLLAVLVRRLRQGFRLSHRGRTTNLT